MLHEALFATAVNCRAGAFEIKSYFMHNMRQDVAMSVMRASKIATKPVSGPLLEGDNLFTFATAISIWHCTLVYMNMKARVSPWHAPYDFDTGLVRFQCCVLQRF